MSAYVLGIFLIPDLPHHAFRTDYHRDFFFAVHAEALGVALAGPLSPNLRTITCQLTRCRAAECLLAIQLLHWAPGRIADLKCAQRAANEACRRLLGK